MKRTGPFFLGLAIVLAVAACYLNSMGNPFIWDQEVVIVDNPLIRSWRHLPDVFKTPLDWQVETGVGFYRPMEVLSYMADYSLWKLNPFGTHLTSILVHLCNALLLLGLLGRIGLPRPAAFWAALAFAVHPVNSESVTYSIRGDLLAALFSLISFLSFFRFLPSENSRAQRLRRAAWGIASAGALLLALLSKESAVVLPVILLVYLFLFRSQHPPPGARRAVGLAAVLLFIALAYAAIRMGFLSHSCRQALSLISEASLAERILTLPRILLTYIGLLTFPLHLHMEYHFVERSLASPYLWGFLLLAGMGGMAFSRWARAADEEGLPRWAGFFLLWFFIGLAPFYNLWVPLHATLTEHWAYFAGVGWIAFLATLGWALFRRARGRWGRRLWILGVLGLLVGYGFATARRNLDWSDPMRLYQHDLQYEPNSFILHNNIGVIYFRRGDRGRAKEAFLNSVRVSPGGRYAVAHNNLGVIYEQEGDLNAAEAAFKRSIHLTRYALAYGNLSRLYLKQGRMEEAIRVALEGRALYPFDLELQYVLGIGYYWNRQFREARELLSDLLKRAPGYKDASRYLEEIRRLGI